MGALFRYRYPQIGRLSWMWEVGLVLEADDESVSLQAKLRHDLETGADERLSWRLHELERKGPELPLPPYLRPQDTRLSLSDRGIPEVGYALPAFLLPPICEEEISEGTTWGVTDSSSGIALELDFTVQSLVGDELRLVAEGDLESEEFEVEVSAKYRLSVTHGRLLEAKIVVDTYRDETSRNLIIGILPVDV